MLSSSTHLLDHLFIPDPLSLPLAQGWLVWGYYTRSNRCSLVALRALLLKCYREFESLRLQNPNKRMLISGSSPQVGGVGAGVGRIVCSLANKQHYLKTRPYIHYKFDHYNHHHNRQEKQNKDTSTYWPHQTVTSINQTYKYHTEVTWETPCRNDWIFENKFYPTEVLPTKLQYFSRFSLFTYMLEPCGTSALSL